MATNVDKPARGVEQGSGTPRFSKLCFCKGETFSDLLGS